MPLTLDALIEQLKTGAATNEIYGVSAPSSRSRATVEKVLEEAVEVLASDGVSGLSFRALARRCDMRLSNLQYYFTTQDDLLTALTRYALVERFEELRRKGTLKMPDPRERFHAYLTFRMDRAADPRARLITTAIKDLAQRHDGPAKHFAATCRFHNAVLEDMIAELSPDPDAAETARKAAMIAALLDSLGPVGGCLYEPPAGLRGAVLEQAHRLAGL